MFQKNDRIYIVAEIGGNFTDYETAVVLIDQAKESGVDAIKLQTYRGNTVSSKHAVFDMENTGVLSQLDFFKKYELSEDLHRKVYAYAKKKGLDIFSTPAHITDVQMLEKLDTDIYKIGADDLTNLPFLKEVAKLNKPVILSTGMSTMEEVKEAVNTIVEEGNSNIVLMHTVSLYPTATQYVNLDAIKTLQKEFPQFMIGYSDHTLGIEACVFAAVMGAGMIEKHFTYDKKAEGPDHMLSATQEEMKNMVEKIRLYEQMRGNGIKMPVGDEVKNRRNNRKSIICIRNMKKGERITETDLDIKRPGFGILPKYRDMLIGRKVIRDIEQDMVLQWSDFE